MFIMTKQKSCIEITNVTINKTRVVFFISMDPLEEMPKILLKNTSKSPTVVKNLK